MMLRRAANSRGERGACEAKRTRPNGSSTTKDGVVVCPSSASNLMMCLLAATNGVPFANDGSNVRICVESSAGPVNQMTRRAIPSRAARRFSKSSMRKLPVQSASCRSTAAPETPASRSPALLAGVCRWISCARVVFEGVTRRPSARRPASSAAVTVPIHGSGERMGWISCR